MEGLSRHPHSLTFQTKKSGCICDICGDPIPSSQYAYRCNICDYDNCSACYQNCQLNKLHPHRLKLYASSKVLLNNEAKYICCNICNRTIPSNIYRCPICKEYDICEECYIQYQVKHHHPLNYLPKPFYHTGSYECDVCETSFTGPSYHCNTCKNYDTCLSCFSKYKMQGDSIPLENNPRPETPKSLKEEEKIPTFQFQMIKLDKDVEKMNVEELDQLEKACTDLKKKVKDRKEAIKEQQANSNECVVCFDKPRAMVFSDCGHFCCCDECGSQLKTCPICKKNITTKIKVYSP